PYCDRIDEKGGMLPAIEAGFFRKEIADAAFTYQREIDAKRKLIVGVNAFQESDEKPIETLVIGEAIEKQQIERLRKIKAQRDTSAAYKALDEIKRVAATKANLLLPLLGAAEARCTVGELLNAL